MLILHGENTLKSRSVLFEKIDQARETQTQIRRLPAKTLSLAELESSLGSTDLFKTAQLIIIEELHSLPTSNRKKELISLLGEFSDNSEIILWEKRALTATMLKKFPQATNQLFKISNKMFAWLDSINGQQKNASQQHQLLMEAIDQDGEHYCLMMLARQVRLLIEVKEGSQVKGAPFMIKKLENQARTFSLPQLIQLHKKLLKLDVDLKTSANNLPLRAMIDLLLLNR